MSRTTRTSRRLVALLAALPLWLACSDAPTGPPAATPRAESVHARDAARYASDLWQAKGSALMASAGLNPLATVRATALLSLAQYAAVVDADYGGGQAQYEARRGAIAGASAQLLTYLFPTAAASVAQMVLDEANAGPGRVHPQFTRGVAAGRAMGDALAAWAAADGFATPWNRVPVPTGAGLWMQTPGVAPAGFQFPAMRPYTLVTQGQFRPVTPPTFGSAEFLTALAFVRQTTLGRTPEQIAIAHRWNVTPPYEWIAIGAQLARSAGMDEREVAHLNALLGAAALDAFIGCWEAKYYYQYIRPSQADPAITMAPPLAGYPPYTLPHHPSYPSGHSCLSASLATVLGAWFPDPGTVTMLEARVTEAGMSRIYGGLHYTFDVSAGQQLGRDVASWAMAFDRERGLLSRVVPD